MPTPVFSIVTAVYNCVDGLGTTIESLRSQTCRDFEYIVVDGASTDGTVDLLHKSGDTITRWISEPDDGISDAFNKCVRLAQGRIVLFLGAGDTLARPSVIEEAISFVSLARKPVFFYGDVLYDYGSTQRLVHQNFSMRRFRKYSCIPHQTMFLDKWFFENYGLFDTSYRITMDYEHTARFIQDFQPEYLNTVIARMSRTGVSTNPWNTHREMNRVRSAHRLSSAPSIFLSWLPIVLKAGYCRVCRRPW